MPIYDLCVVTTAAQRPDNEPRWAISIGLVGGPKRDWYWSRRVSARQYQRQLQRGQSVASERSAFETVYEMKDIAIQEARLPSIVQLFEQTEPGPGMHFVLRFLWNFVVSRNLEAHKVERLSSLALYSNAEWHDHGSGLSAVDTAFIRDRTASGWGGPQRVRATDEGDNVPQRGRAIDEGDAYNDPPPPYSP